RCNTQSRTRDESWPGCLLISKRLPTISMVALHAAAPCAKKQAWTSSPSNARNAVNHACRTSRFYTWFNSNYRSWSHNMSYKRLWIGLSLVVVLSFADGSCSVNVVLLPGLLVQAIVPPC